MSELLTLNVDEVGAHPKNVRREVIDQNEVIPAGCPVRFEYRGFAQEMDMPDGSVFLDFGGDA